MTKAEFIEKFKEFLYENGMSDAVLLEDADYKPMMCFDDFNGNIVNDYVSVVGFDEDDDLYIDFIDTNCTAYDEDLDCNSNDAWDLLWDAILTEYDCVDEVKAQDW